MDTSRAFGNNPLVGVAVGDTVSNVGSVIDALDLMDVPVEDGAPIGDGGLRGVRVLLECVVDALRYELENYEKRAGALYPAPNRTPGNFPITHPRQLRAALARNLHEVQSWIDDISVTCMDGHPEYDEVR